MSDRRRCVGCGMAHFADEPCPSCSGEMTSPVRAEEKPEPHIPYTGKLPAYDPQVLEDRNFWAVRIGRAAAEELCPECDPLPEERRF